MEQKQQTEYKLIFDKAQQLIIQHLNIFCQFKIFWKSRKIQQQ